MIHLDQIIRCELAFPAQFSNLVNRSYGMLLYEPSIPDSSDCNHAVIMDAECNPGAAVADLVTFYQSKNLQPRVYSAWIPGQLERLTPALTRAGFQILQEETRFFSHTVASEIVPNCGAVIKQVDRMDDALASMLLRTEGVERPAKVLAKKLLHPHFALFVAYVEGAPAAIASLCTESAATRVDDVKTDILHRRRGYCSTVIDYVCRYHRKRQNDMLYLWTTNPEAARIYQRAGFTETPLNQHHWMAWLPFS